MKKAFILLTLLIFCLAQNANAAFVKEESKFITFCEKYAQVAAIYNAYPRITPSIQALPFIPFVGIGIVTGMVQSGSALENMCDVLITLSKLNNLDGMFFTANYLNTLTDRKWENHLNMMNSTYSLAGSLIDFESGKMRPGVLKSASTHAEINSFMKESYSWYNQTFNNRDAQIQTRGERETEMNQYASMVSQSANLKEITACPTPSSTDYDRIYKKEVFPQETIQSQSQDDIDFYKSQLLAMGPKFMNNQKQMKDYADQFSDLLSNATTIVPKLKIKKEVTDKRDPKKLDRDGKPKVTQVTISKNTYEYQEFPNDQIVNSFKEKWTAQWSSWVTAQFLSRGSTGLLINPKERVENEFRDLYYECQISRLMGGWADDNTYQAEAEKRQKQCIEKTKVDQKSANNLFSYYVDQVSKSIRVNKAATAKIWTVQSWYLGQNRIVNKKVEDNIQSEEVVCEAAKNISSGEMNKINVKQMNVNNDLKEFIGKQYMQKTVMQKAELEARKKDSEETAHKMQYLNAQGKKDKKNSRAILPTVPVDTSIGRKDYSR